MGRAMRVAMSGSIVRRMIKLLRPLRAASFGLALMLAAGTATAQQPPRPPPTAVPISAVAAARQDVPVYLRGLGQAQAYSAVLIRARVDGTLMKFVPTEGQHVKQNDLIAVIDPRPYQAALDQAEAKRDSDRAMAANAQLDFSRYSSLAKQDFASRQQVDTQRASVAQLTAAIAGDTAAVEAAKLNLSFCYILSPIDGRVGLRLVDPGNLVHANDIGGIVSITQVQPISVLFTLPQADLPRIAAAMAAGTLPVLAYDGGGLTQLGAGTLLTPDNAIDAATGTIKLKATFANTDNRLWPGQFVEARLLVETLRGALTVPSSAVQHGPAGLYVYVVKPGDTVVRQDVQVSEDDGQTAVIGSGLADGARVVTQGVSRLQDGSKVALNPAGAG